MIVVAFHTGGKYEEHARELVASAENVGLQVELLVRPTPASWRDGIALKPGVVLEAMKKHPDEDILYVDADCRFVKYPTLFDERRDIDIAWNWVRPRWPHGCVLFFRANQKGRRMAKLWAQMFDRYPIIHLDEVHLYYAYREMQQKGGVVHLSLPPSYTWMENWARRFPTSEVVIRHLGTGPTAGKQETLNEGNSFLKP